MYLLVAPCELLTVTSRYGASCIFYTDGFLIEGSLHNDTLLRLNGLQRDVLFSLNSIKAMLSRKIAHQTLWCMNVNNYAGACARTE
jgi:hypothetical protein